MRYNQNGKILPIVTICHEKTKLLGCVHRVGIKYTQENTEKTIQSIIVKFRRQKCKRRISKQVLQENKARQISRKTNIYFPLIRTRGDKKCLFFGKFGVFFFLVTPVLRFALLPYYRRFKSCKSLEDIHNATTRNFINITTKPGPNYFNVSVDLTSVIYH